MSVEGTLLAGRYRLGELLGQGGMSEVRRAFDQRLGRTVAVKLLRPELARDPAFDGRLRREAQSAASLHHPAIVAVYDTGEQLVDGAHRPYIVMELVAGRTLRDILAVDGRLPPPEAIRITSDICAALDEAHRGGIIHRDVKPGNVMVTPTGAVKVMDFGIARLTAPTGTLTQTADLVGTAHYMSPEQARGEHVDARSDVYSTGCLLYELLTGSPPFTGDSPVVVAYQHVREDPLPPSRITADVPPDLDAVVLKALAKNPDERYQSAGELRADLQRVLRGEPVVAAPTAAPTPPVPVPPPTTVLVREPPRRSHRGLGYALLALGVVVVFVIAALVARAVVSGGTGDFPTPDVVGQSLPDAQQVLNQAGLHVSVRYRYSNQPQGVVVSQLPAHPILIRGGQTVELVVSRGPHLVTVPTSVIGAPQAEAEADLRNVGLKVGQVVPVNSRQPAGQVLRTNPAAGSQARYGSTVVLTVSNGHLVVPDVVGQPADAAASRLQHAGFTVVERTAPAYDKRVPVNQVVTENPAGGSSAPVGSTVTIYLNQPPPAKHGASPSSSPSSSPTPSASRGH